MKIREILELDVTTSTQDIAIDRARAGEASGLLVVARSQTGGRGRGGRAWFSPPGVNLYASLVYREPLATAEAQRPMMATSVALLETARAFGVDRARIKWPNDIVVHGRKLAGVLAESAIVAGRIDWMVIGVGLNVNWRGGDLLGPSFPPELAQTATSIAIETNSQVALSRVQSCLLDEWARAFAHPRLWHTWVKGALARGERVTVHAGERLLTGQIERYEIDGALTLALGDGRYETLSFGDLVLPTRPR